MASGHYTNKAPYVLTGALTARPSAATVPLGSTYLDTTTGVVWRCILVGSTPTWYAPAGGVVSMGADSAMALTAGGTWDTWACGTWVSSALVGFTHASGVLTYTGPGEIVTVQFQGSGQYAGGARNTIWGVSAGSAAGGPTPDTNQSHQHVIRNTAQERMGAQWRGLIATGATIRMKVLGSTADTLTVESGTSMIVIGG